MDAAAPKQMPLIFIRLCHLDAYARGRSCRKHRGCVLFNPAFADWMQPVGLSLILRGKFASRLSRDAFIDTVKLCGCSDQRGGEGALTFLFRKCCWLTLVAW